MADGIDKLKRCPSCRALTAPMDCRQIVSRSSGKTTISWRCRACMGRKEAALRQVKKDLTSNN